MQNDKEHPTPDQRGVIEHMLKEGASLRSIPQLSANIPISNEIVGHMQFRQRSCWGNGFKNCIHRFGCDLTPMCDNPSSRSKARLFRCFGHSLRSSFVKEHSIRPFLA